ncbi:hypothetical protein [uncultured Cyclobacterium sp.]|uniref:hypothetical protein n=1 Tax=uncultured Cyclobacterium sp. TaxID=453820 RepID=UPI0030EF5B59|tara:strand:- start:65509 stop:65937 length:429 start_codon:yes stop_codon:yes gene_type:complete
MENKNEKLWEKYWKGETTLEEENLLFSEIEADQEEGSLKDFYSGIETIRLEKPKGISLPLRKQQYPWQKLAAVLLVFLTLTACWWGYREYEKQQQELAYQQVVEAMGKIQVNLRKGTSQLEGMEKIKYLNTGAHWYENNKNN